MEPNYFDYCLKTKISILLVKMTYFDSILNCFPAKFNICFYLIKFTIISTGVIDKWVLENTSRLKKH